MFRNGLGENLVWLPVTILKTVDGVAGLQPSAMKLLCAPECGSSVFFLKWKLGIRYISNINRCHDSQTDMGVTKLVVVLQENLVSYVVFGRAFDLPAMLLKSKK